MLDRSPHLCVAYSAREQFAAEVRRFVLEGLRRHIRVGYLGRVRLDLGGVEFVDHRSLLILDEHATREGRMVELIRVPRPVRRLLGFLEHDQFGVTAA